MKKNMNYTVVENIDSYDVKVRSVREQQKNGKKKYFKVRVDRTKKHTQNTTQIAK
jgi:hypothetical protein